MISLSISDISDDDAIPESSSASFRPKVNFKVRHVRRQEKSSSNPSILQHSVDGKIESKSEKEKNDHLHFLKKSQNFKEEDEEEDDEIPSDSDMIDSGDMTPKITHKSRKVELVVSSEEDEELHRPTKGYYFEKYGFQGNVPNDGNQMSDTNVIEDNISSEQDEELIIPSINMPPSNLDHALKNKEITEALLTDLDDIDDSDADLSDNYDDVFELGLGKNKTKVLCTNSSYQLALSKFTSKIASLHQLKEKTEAEILHLTKEYEQVLSEQQKMITKAFKMPQSSTDLTDSTET